MPYLRTWILGGKYAVVGPIAVAWLAFFLITAIRSVGMACLQSSPDGFCTIYWYSWVALAIAVPAVWSACMLGSAVLVVSALAGAELARAAIIWFGGWRRMRNRK